MAAASGQPDPLVMGPPDDELDFLDERVPAIEGKYDLVRSLLETVPFQFNFFQAVRLLERLQPDRQPVGRFVAPGREAARFGSHSHYAFPASQIQGLTWEPNRAPALKVNFMGLYGPSGVLPNYYTALIMERLRSKDNTLATFLDLFNHRMISLFYLAWEKYRFPIAYERGERDRFSHHFLDLIGIGTPGLQDRQAVQDDSLIFYSGLLSLHPRSAVALRGVLWDFFDVPVSVEQFVGAWYPLDEPTQCRFEKANTYSEQLGVGAIVGDEIWDQQSGILVRLGPLTLEQYLDFLPTGSAYEPLHALVKFFCGGQLDFQIQLVLKRDEVPMCELGGETEAAPRLGWVSWAKTRDMNRDPGDTILRF